MKRSESKVAALFVQKNGVYHNLEDVDPWPEDRDARNYAGPWPVVAHPPCSLSGLMHRQGAARPHQLAGIRVEGKGAKATLWPTEGEF